MWRYRADPSLEHVAYYRWAQVNALRLFCFFLAALCTSSSLQAQSTVFQFLEKPGPYPVGLRVVHQYDHARTFPSSSKSPRKPSTNDGYRPLQTLIWYPARPSTDQPMTVGDYAKLADTELHFDTPDPGHNKWRSQLDASFDVRLWAMRNAKAATGHYPVLIYAASDSSISWENADICEYLASHGYIVIASSSMGRSTRDMTDDIEGIGAQASDISFLITYAKTLPDANVSKVAVVSWSWGGISSLFAAARDPRIKALVSMDGSMRYYPGLVKAAGDVHPERMDIPLLFFTSEYPNFLEDLEKYGDGSPADRVGPNVLNAWTQGDLFTVNMVGMSHGEFGSMFQRRKNAERFAEDQVADYGRDDANTSYAWVARYAVMFLDAYLKNDGNARIFLEKSPNENGVPKHFLAIGFRAGRAFQATEAATGRNNTL